MLFWQLHCPVFLLSSTSNYLPLLQPSDWMTVAVIMSSLSPVLEIQDNRLFVFVVDYVELCQKNNTVTCIVILVVGPKALVVLLYHPLNNYDITV